MRVIRTKRPSWKEVAEELQEEREENQRLEKDIDRLQRLTLMKAAADFESDKARELARERPSQVAVMARAIAEDNDIIHGEVVDGSHKKAGLDQTDPQVCSADKLRACSGTY